MGILLLSPIMIGAALYIFINDGRPVIFRQVRVGRQGRSFRIFKFRTMVRGAESLADGLAAQSETKGPAFKMRDDPRITPCGRRLRRASIDELPQLFNVLRGEMSLVGPRPAPPREVAGYDLWHRRRLSMKPGITGLWQVSSRLDDDFDERAQLDLEYIDRWSLWLDMKIVLKTVPTVFDQNGH
jgi:lipopolysaccharide/colanic/teichoic acid biosynthesis glycosyltransferase